jgi:hypothetical protein
MNELTLKDIDAWAGGVASPETEAAVWAALEQPGSPARQYVDWLQNPPAFVREHGGIPDLVAEELANLPAEVRTALRHMNDDLPPEIHFGGILAAPSSNGSEGDGLEFDADLDIDSLVLDSTGPLPPAKASGNGAEVMANLALIAQQEEARRAGRIARERALRQRLLLGVLLATAANVVVTMLISRPHRAVPLPSVARLRGLEDRVEEIMAGRRLDEPLVAQGGDMLALRDDVRSYLLENPGVTSPTLIGFLARLRRPSDNLTILIPAYFYPAGEDLKLWDQVIASASKVPTIAIVNPSNGPGTAIDPNYSAVLRRAKQAGVTLIGYVFCPQRDRPVLRPIAEVQAEIRKWTELYPEITGVFLDGQPTDLAGVPYFEAVVRYARVSIRDAIIVTNPGTIPAEEYYTVANPDIICVCEDKLSRSNYHMPSWCVKYRPRRMAALWWDAGAKGSLESAIVSASSNRIGCLFVTDDSDEANPWDSLSKYWDREVEQVQQFNLKLRAAANSAVR